MTGETMSDEHVKKGAEDNTIVAADDKMSDQSDSGTAE